MKISPVINISAFNARTLNTASYGPQNTVRQKTSENPIQAGFQQYYYPVNIFSFTGSQKKPFTDEDYKNAREYLEKALANRGNTGRPINIKGLSLQKLNGIQKGIEVFDGLTMREIAFMLNKPIILLNRGCNNQCVHCGFMATPFSKDTLDKMSYEDYKALIEGIKELECRMDNKVSLFSEMGLFLDSDCIDIELEDKNGKKYDWVDCARLLGDDIEKVTPLFDTSGWNPKSKKYQARAEKFVDFVLEHEPDELDDINVSINPYHSIYAKAKELEKEGNTEKAAELKQRYAQRIANVLFTFSPLVKGDYNICLLARAIPYDETDTGLDNAEYFRIIQNVAAELFELYEYDLEGKRKYVQNEADIKFFMGQYSGLLKFSEPRNLFPWGRAEGLFNHDTDGLGERTKSFRDLYAHSREYASNLINPNGELVLSSMDISARTDLGFNFENKDKPVKPFAHEIEPVHPMTDKKLEY